MERRRRAGSTGYVVVLLGAATFVVGCFLPYFDYGPAGLGTLSLYRLTIYGRGEPATIVGGALFLFAGVGTVAWVAMAGVRGSGGWTRQALAAVAIAWSLAWIGTLLGAYRLGTPRLVGHWVLFFSVVVVVIGTIMVLVSARADAAKLAAPQPTS